MVYIVPWHRRKSHLHYLLMKLENGIEKLRESVYAIFIQILNDDWAGIHVTMGQSSNMEEGRSSSSFDKNQLM